jgi:hypothetical protein
LVRRKHKADEQKKKTPFVVVEMKAEEAISSETTSRQTVALGLFEI